MEEIHSLRRVLPCDPHFHRGFPEVSTKTPVSTLEGKWKGSVVSWETDIDIPCPLPRLLYAELASLALLQPSLAPLSFPPPSSLFPQLPSQVDLSFPLQQ